MHERIFKVLGFAAISSVTIAPGGEFQTTQRHHNPPTQAVLPGEIPSYRLPEGIRIETDKDPHIKGCVLAPSQIFTKRSRCR